VIYEVKKREYNKIVNVQLVGTWGVDL